MVNNKTKFRLAAALIIVFILGLSTAFVIDFWLHQTVSTGDATMLVIIGVLVLFILPTSLRSRLPGLKFGSLELQIDKVEQDVETLRSQVYTLGHTAIVQQVNTLNRLAIVSPELAQRAWKKLETLDVDQIRQLSYAYAFIDIFDMLRRFQTHEDLAKELYELWQKEWMPDLLASQTGKVLKEHPELLSYYSKETRIALGLQPESESQNKVPPGKAR